VLSICAEPGALDLESLKKVLGVRAGQIKRMVTAPGDDGLAETTVHLIRVSERDIRGGVAQMKEEPGVHSVEIKRRKRAAATEEG
jgi:putative Mg2+ transporter-C (MgtC) family protein